MLILVCLCSFFVSFFAFILTFKKKKQSKTEMNGLKMDVFHTSKFNLITSLPAQLQQSPPAR